jgi:hypothetical protein
MKPAAFLRKCADWLAIHKGSALLESDFNDDDIWNLQRLFLQEIFSSKKNKRFLPLVHDLTLYHHLYAATLLAPFRHSDDERQTPGDSRSSRFTLNPATRLAHFSYDIDELLDCGEPQILWMYEHLAPSGSQAVIYRHGGAVCTESLALPYIHVLEQIRENSDHDYLSRTGLSSDEVDEFLHFAVEEGIIECREISKEVAFQ